MLSDILSNHDHFVRFIAIIIVCAAGLSWVVSAWRE
jgi:hypothetical protein